MRISVYPSDRNACGNLRIKFPAVALREAGHDVVVNEFKGHHPEPIKLLSDGPPQTSPVADVIPPNADVVVIQRPATQRLYEMVQILRTKGVKVVVDVDDALWSIHRDNVSWGVYNGEGRAHWKWLLKACREADLVTVTTPELAEKTGGVVVPNCIPESMLEVGRWKIDNWDEEPFKIGWAATSLTHPGDPAATGGDVAEWVRDNPQAVFVAVGGRPEREPLLFGFRKDENENRYMATSEVEQDAWARAVSFLDVSLVPLEESLFNRSKSALKMLESAAAGCAVVASPTPDNERVAGLGIGTIAKKGKWYKRLNQLAEGDAAREQAEGNLEVVKDLTIKKNAWRWLEAWASAMQ